MKSLLKRLWTEEEGQDLTEYALLSGADRAWRHRSDENDRQHDQRRISERGKQSRQFDE